MKNQQITITFPKKDIRYKEELQRMKKEESINVSAFIVSAIKGELGSLWIKKTKQQVREIRNKIMDPIERRPQYDSDDDVIIQAVQQFYDELKKRKILRWKSNGSIDLQRWQTEWEIFRWKFLGIKLTEHFVGGHSSCSFYRI